MNQMADKKFPWRWQWRGISIDRTGLVFGLGIVMIRIGADIFAEDWLLLITIGPWDIRFSLKLADWMKR